MPLRGVRQRSGRRNKFNAKPCVIDGVRFASQREGKRYVALRQLERRGEISMLRCHPKFNLLAWGGGLERPEKIGIYTGDFEYFVPETGELVLEDVKAPPSRTEAYQLRKKIFEANTGRKITEVA